MRSSRSRRPFSASRSASDAVNVLVMLPNAIGVSGVIFRWRSTSAIPHAPDQIGLPSTTTAAATPGVSAASPCFASSASRRWASVGPVAARCAGAGDPPQPTRSTSASRTARRDMGRRYYAPLTSP